MRPAGRLHVVLGVIAAGLNTAALLRRMRSELIGSGRLSRPTVAWMYVTYGTHAGATSLALVMRAGTLPLPRPAVWLGGSLALAGTGLMLAGMDRFTGPEQVSGVEPGPLVTGGVYRVSRNPQYVGYVLALAGLAIARRSAVAAASATAVAVVYRWWIPVEERHLERCFGTDYRAYLDRTPRWLTAPRHAGRRTQPGAATQQRRAPHG